MIGKLKASPDEFEATVTQGADLYQQGKRDEAIRLCLETADEQRAETHRRVGAPIFSAETELRREAEEVVCM